MPSPTLIEPVEIIADSTHAVHGTQNHLAFSRETIGPQLARALPSLIEPVEIIAVSTHAVHGTVNHLAVSRETNAPQPTCPPPR
ncbi:hypothetical protein JF66_20925 [Cryobacterium sp. MLB-32]|nr:hypothetical protein JF66_20925 [Cryobacterium sp. MLB-32]